MQLSPHHKDSSRNPENSYPCASTEIFTVELKIAFPKIGIRIWDPLFSSSSPVITSNVPSARRRWYTIQATISSLHHQTYTVGRGRPIQVPETWRRGADISKSFFGGQMHMGRTCDDVVINLIVSPLGLAVPSQPSSPAVLKASRRGPWFRIMEKFRVFHLHFNIGSIAIPLLCNISWQVLIFENMTLSTIRTAEDKTQLGSSV